MAFNDGGASPADIFDLVLVVKRPLFEAAEKRLVKRYT
jgi:hypothetical protein